MRIHRAWSRSATPLPDASSVERTRTADATTYVRQYRSNQVRWGPPPMLPGLVATTPAEVAATERIAWQRRVADAAAGLLPAVEVEQVEAWSDRMISVRHVDGESLRSFLTGRRRRSGPDRQAGRDLGRWMAELQRVDEAPGRQSVEELVGRCEARVAHGDVPDGLRRAAAARVAALTDRSEVPPVGLSHGDVSTTNVLWDASTRRWGVIDFEHGAPRPAAHDVSVLIANVLVDTFHPLSSARRSAEILGGVLDAHAEHSGRPGETTLAWATAAAWLCDDFLPRLRTRPGGAPLVRLRSRAVARVMRTV